MILSKWLIAFVAVYGGLGGILFDYVVPATARQHQGNPAWPPHAKFHNGQTMMLGVLNMILSALDVVGGVDHPVDDIKCRQDAGGIVDTAAMRLGPLGTELPGGSLTAREPDDGMTSSQQLIDDGGADKAGGTGDEDFHG